MKLNIERINAKAPYKVTPIPGSDFVSFLTDYGVQYAVGFDKDDTTMPFTETYQFSIINGNNKKSPRDPKVRETIIAIVENFFMENQEVMSISARQETGGSPCATVSLSIGSTTTRRNGKLCS